MVIAGIRDRRKLEEISRKNELEEKLERYKDIYIASALYLNPSERSWVIPKGFGNEFLGAWISDLRFDP